MASKQKRILLFDDDSFSLDALKTYLELVENYQIELTASGEVLDRLATERFDLICVDVMIQSESPDAEGEPVMNVQYPGVKWQKIGIEFLKRLRAGAYAGVNTEGTPANVPVIVLSAIADVHNNSGVDAIAQIENSANTLWFEKPFDVEKIIEAIHTLIAE